MADSEELDMNAHENKFYKRKFKEKFMKGATEEETSWRKKRSDTKGFREDRLIKQKEAAQKLKQEKLMKAGTVSFDDDEVNSDNGIDNEQGQNVASHSDEPAAKKAKKIKTRPYSISIAVPGAFLNNAQSAELRTYMAGQVARAATLFCVDEIIVYDEAARLKQEEVDAYWNGAWTGNLFPSEKNLEGNLYLAKILEYIECPQYLRRTLFSFHKALKFAGLLNPLDAQHHLKATDLSIPYREGVITDKPSRKGRGPIVDVGLDRELQLEDTIPMPPGTRVTVEMTNTAEDYRMLRGKLTSVKKVREATGYYWGYNVSLAKSLKECLDRSKYDVILGTSPRGKSMNDFHVNLLNKPRILVVFGGTDGVEAAIEADESLTADTPELAFDRLINPVPHNGSRSERVEENILVTLSELSLRMQQLE